MDRDPVERTGARFVELLGRTCFSFLEGASHPEEMVEAADALGQRAIAIVDRDGLYGVVRGHAEAKRRGLAAIVGAELTLEMPGIQGSIALLAIDHDGYSNLCKLLTIAHADHEKGTAGIDASAVAEHARGLFAILPIDRGPLDERVIEIVKGGFGERAFAAVHRRLDRYDAARLAAAHDLEARGALPVVASARPMYHRQGRKPLADILYCIKNKTTLDEAGAALSPNREAFLRGEARMRAMFRDRPAWIDRTVEIAERCAFRLDDIKYRFPCETLCEDGESADDALRRRAWRGAAARYPGGVPEKIRAQMEKELALIRELEVAPYFLSVQHVVEIARGREILCQGRGSAANSAVCYALGITAVDPARSSLLFERFLSAERVSGKTHKAEPPDIDVDFEHERREEVIQDIYDIYGRDRAAMVSEVISYRGKSALREVGKAFGFSLEQVDRLSGLVMHMDSGISEERVAEAGLDPKDMRVRQAILLASELEGFPRHLSIHVGGFVLSSEPLEKVAPIEPARMEGRTVIPWDKDDLDDLGFFKVDVLGLGMLTAIRKCLALIHDGAAKFDPIQALAEIPPEDEAVYAAIQKADTVGVFQIESRAQMAMLPRLKPKDFYDLVIEVAIVRPGPIQGGMVHPYLRRRSGLEPATSPHPCLESILKRTLGVPLFQEQVMQIAMVGAGYSPGEADQLRRDMAAWRKNGRLERHHGRLMRGFAERGISAEFAEKLYQQIHGFGEYGFPESHAASFALLVYASAWLKVHHPAAFACALLNSQPMGFYSPSSIVRDLQAHGVEARPPCVVASAWDNTLEDGALRLGFRQIKGLAQAAGDAIVAARAEEAFRGVEDLVRRARLKKNEVEALAEAGALEAIVRGRRQALWRARAPRVGGLFTKEPIEREARVELPELTAVEQLSLDYGSMGLSIDDHPMRHVRPRLPRGTKSARELGDMKNGRSVAVAGLVIGRQRPATASGITFVTLEDETGIMNLVVRRDTFEANYSVARHAQLVLVRGRVEREGDVIHVLVREMQRLTMPDDRALASRSRDFH